MTDDYGEKIDEIVKRITEKFDPLKVILFGANSQSTLRQAQGDIIMVNLSNHQGDNLPIPNEKEPENRNPYFN